MDTKIEFPNGMSEAEFDTLCRFLEDPEEAKGADKAPLKLTPELKRQVRRPAWYVGLPPEPESKFQQ